MVLVGGEKLNKWRVLGLTIVTWLVFQIVAKLISVTTHRDLLSITATIWSWMSLIMGTYMKYKLNRWKEFAYGLCMWLISLFPFAFIFTIIYFGRCYYQLEALNTSRQSNNNKTEIT